MTGFFPIMMFAPARPPAWRSSHCARPERRKVVGGMMFSLALTSFVTGVTEPIEFTFMFIAPVLYAIHAVLTGVSMALTWALGMQDGFGFSAGAIDYCLNLGIATKPWLIIPVGLCLRGGLLRGLPLRDHQVQPPDAGPRARRGARRAHEGARSKA